jgi:hypothetical protein
MEHQKPIYEDHDYSSIEDYLRRQDERRGLSNKAILTSISANRLKSIALVIASSGFAVLLVLFGISLLNEEQVRIVERKTIVEKPIVKASSDISKIQPQLEEIEKTINSLSNSDLKKETPNLLNKKSGSVDKLDVSKKFTVFQTIPSGIYGFKGVVTGLNFSNSKSTYPIGQYCYLELSDDGFTLKHINLASKEKRGPIKYVHYPSVSSFKISPSQFQSARYKCKFLE